MVVGMLLAQFVFGSDWIHSMASSLGTYVLCLVTPPKYVHIVVFIWAMGYMTASHISQMQGDDKYLKGIFDYTGTQMVLTMKLTSFGYNLYDGTYDRDKVFGELKDGKTKKMMEERRKYAVTSLPNPIEYFGYIFCFTCLMAGPAFEYNDYVDGTQHVNVSQLHPNFTPRSVGSINLSQLYPNFTE